MTPEPSPTIDATAVELVLRRAIELAAQAAGPHGADSERLPVAVLHQVAEELSVPAVAVNDALAEYQASLGGPLPAGLTGRRTMADRLVGPGTVTTIHHSNLPAEVTVEHLSRLLSRRHHLRTRAGSGTGPGTEAGAAAEYTIVAVRRRGVVHAVTRSLMAANGTEGLSGVREVRAAAVAAGPGTSSLCLVADVRDHRTQSVVAGTAVAAGTTAVVAVAAVLTAPVVLAGVPAALGAGWLVTRLSHRHRVDQVREEVEMTAGRAASGAPPSTFVSGVIDRIDANLARSAGRLRPTKGS